MGHAAQPLGNEQLAADPHKGGDQPLVGDLIGTQLALDHVDASGFVEGHRITAGSPTGDSLTGAALYRAPGTTTITGTTVADRQARESAGPAAGDGATRSRSLRAGGVANRARSRPAGRARNGARGGADAATTGARSRPGGLRNRAGRGRGTGRRSPRCVGARSGL